MSYSDSFPSSSPRFQANFAANGGRIDPRMTFTRSDTPPTYAAPSAVHYWSNEKHLSSENLFTYSNDIDTGWAKAQATVDPNQASPDGGTTAALVTENTANNTHSVYTGYAATSGTTYTYSGYFKANGRSLVHVRNAGTGADVRVEFDLSGSGTAITRNGSASNLAISQIGSTGWYKCSYDFTAGGSSTYYTTIYLASAANTITYTGDGTSGAYVWGQQLNTTGETVLNETSGSIHRSYAPSLKSVATAGQPRFEYSTDGQSAAKGILIEGQSQNLFAYSDDFANQWTKTRTLASESAAVGPTGALDADLIYADGTAADSHHLYSSCTVTAASHTFSVYAKYAGVQYIQLEHRVTGGGNAQFDLVNGTFVATNAIGAMEPVGNGWYRCSVTETQSAGTAFARIWLMGGSGVSDYNWDGDSYSGVLLYGAQYEANSFPSSLVSSNGSATTRAAESLSVATADIGYTGGDFSLVFETPAGTGQGSYPMLFRLGTSGNNANRLQLYKDDASANSSDNWYAYLNSAGLGTVTGTAGSSKVAVSFASSDLAIDSDTGSIFTNTSGFPPLADHLAIGCNDSGTSNLNGHVKRVALYNEALSDTNLQALTS